jgi:DNA-directed RNA polymerase alpha subunit
MPPCLSSKSPSTFLTTSGTPCKRWPPRKAKPPTVILRAVEESVAAAAKSQDNQPGKWRDLVQTLSTPVADLRLSARPAFALQSLNIQNVYELVQQSPTDLFRLPNFGNRSLKEITEKWRRWSLPSG